MDRGKVIIRGVVAASVALFATYGCERPNPYKLTGDASAQEDCPPATPNPTGGNGNNPSGGQGANDPTGGQGASIPDPGELDARVIDYGEALRTASLKLVGNLPTANQIDAMANEPEATQPDQYASMVDEMLSDPLFTVRMLEYWRNVFKMYGDDVEIEMQPAPSRETAPTFATRIVVEGRPWTDLLTATTDTCPTYDEASESFVSAECDNQIVPAGVLTDPGIHSLYWGNLAFRRNRFFHETFLCRNANASGGAEPVSDPSPVGGCGIESPSNYVSPWPITSIAGACDEVCTNGNAECVNFYEYNTTVVCANCHATWNHRAPLFANFDRFGDFQSSPQVLVPVSGSPFAVQGDWLPDNEPTAWKYNMPAADLTELGNVMKDDEEVQYCMVKRMWNYAMSRGDIVINETPVPNSVVEDYHQLMMTDGSLKEVLKAMLLSDDFVSF